MIYQPEHKNGVMQMPAAIYGRVLMLGLGEGELIPKLLRFPSIARLVVVENDPSVIDAYDSVDDRLRIVEADAHDYYKHSASFFDFIVQDLPQPLPGSHWLKTGGQENTAWVSV